MLRSRWQLLEGHCCSVVDGLDPFGGGIEGLEKAARGGEWEPIKFCDVCLV
jgi:hypothetical protein